MPPPKDPAFPAIRCDPLSIEQLETGLSLLGRDDVDQNAFWDENIDAFRSTVLVAIRETSDALLSPRIPPRWSMELESQLEALIHYIELADRYIARRAVSCGQGAPAFQPVRSSIH